MSSSDVSSVTSFFSTANEGFSTTLASTISSGATTIPLNSTSGLTNGTIFVGIIEPGQTAQQTFTGTVNTGSGSITNVVWTRGNNVGHTSGVTVVDYVTGTDHNMMTKGILKEHTQSGTHSSITATGLAVTGPTTLAGSYDGWTGANESWTYSSYDSANKTGVISVPSGATNKYSAGMRVKFTNNSSTQYGIVTAVASTTLTVYLGTDYSLTNSSITLPYYSVQKVPLGFPIDPTKWTQTYDYSDDNNITSIAQVGSHQLSVPIGAWSLSMTATIAISNSGVNDTQIKVGLSTSTSSFTDDEFNLYLSNQYPNGTGSYTGRVMKNISVSSATVYYQVAQRSGASLACTVRGSSGYAGLITAVCAYL